MSTATPEVFDVAIVGGGMVGASLALALAPLQLRIALIEAVVPDSDQQPSFDARSVALSNGSRRIFESLGVWSALGEIAPIKRIHVSDRGRFGFARLDAADEGIAALGYVVENRVLGMALWRALDGQQERITRYCPAMITALEHRPDHVLLQLAQSAAADAGLPAALSARLVVAADGAQSMVRQAIGVEASVRDYAQTAIITNILPGRFHEQVAYERFTASGPLAILPMTDGRCTVVWTLAPAEATAVMGLADDAFLTRLQDCFGFRLGRFRRVGQRHAYPLTLTLADRQIGERVVIVGNAAQGLHPVAGQGFNLGLRDVASLAEVIADTAAVGGGVVDVGTANVLERYAEWRRTDRRAVVAFTDGLVRLFSNPWAPVRVARSLGLLLFDLNPAAKGLLSRLSTGAAGHMPRLARGLPLVSARRAG